MPAGGESRCKLQWSKYCETEGTVPDLEELRRQLCHGHAVPGVYLVTFSRSPANLLDIICADQSGKNEWLREDTKVTGVAAGKQNAVRLACRLVVKTYEATGGFHVREYLEKLEAGGASPRAI